MESTFDLFREGTNRVILVKGEVQERKNEYYTKQRGFEEESDSKKVENLPGGTSAVNRFI